MKASAVLEHFLSRADWVNRSQTIDRIIVGDANADVDRCIVTWIASFKALRSAVERGIRLVISHEPTFWHDSEATDDPDTHEKLAYIKDHGLIILRNHDCWDRWPEVGIPWAWARFLGLGNAPQAVSPSGYEHRYDIAALPLGEFARQVALHCRALGEPCVQVVGDLTQPVARIGIGTGAICFVPTYRQLGCDCSIVCDDGSCYWAGLQEAEDLRHPVIRVNHGTCEDPGMVTLTEYINTHLDGLRAEHLPHGSSFQLIGSESSVEGQPRRSECKQEA